jgi:hypothetical protein
MSRTPHQSDPPAKRRLHALILAVVIAMALPAIDAGATARPSIIPFVAGPGGREVVVPNGTYVGGAIRAPHDGWLVLRAESPGGVTVDLSETGLSLDDGTSRVIFVGFRFVNGSVRMAGVQDIHFWYCDFSFPPEEWARQYRAAGGTVPADRAARNRFASRMANPLPTSVRARPGVVDPSRGNQRIGFWGSDFHDIGDDAIFLSDTETVLMAGLRIWNVDERQADPGRTYGNSQDWFHNDGIQTLGALRGVAIADSWIGQKIQWEASGRDIVNADFRRLWLAGSSTFGQINDTRNGGRILANTQQDIRAFGNGQTHRSHDNMRTDFVDGRQQAVWGVQFHRPGSFEMVASGVTIGAPAGITVNGDGRLADIAQVRDHRENPANQWRVTHPYASWRTLVGAAVLLPG